MLIKKGDYIVEIQKEEENKDKEIKSGDNKGPESRKDISSGKQISTTLTSPTLDRSTSTISKKNIDWGKMVNTLLSSSKYGGSFRKSLLGGLNDKPIVNWRKELKKFVTESFEKLELTFPNKRFISKGLYLDTLKPKGIDRMKTLVVVLDTSSSISHDMGKTFLIEVNSICEQMKVNRLFIMYCSDDLDHIDEVSSRPSRLKIPSNTTYRHTKNVKFDIWPTTGANRSGFVPPFECLKTNNINPSAMVYLTDTGGKMPNPNNYGINRYKKRVIWFICSPRIWNTPPFGKVLFAPAPSITFSKKN